MPSDLIRSRTSALCLVSRSRMRRGSFSVCKCLHDLLRGPSSGRMLGDIKVQHLATIMFQDNEYEQHLHRDGRHGKEIGRHHVTDMVVQECPPGLVRRAAESAQEA